MKCMQICGRHVSKKKNRWTTSLDSQEKVHKIQLNPPQQKSGCVYSFHSPGKELIEPSGRDTSQNTPWAPASANHTSPSQDLSRIFLGLCSFGTFDSGPPAVSDVPDVDPMSGMEWWMQSAAIFSHLPPPPDRPVGRGK